MLLGYLRSVGPGDLMYGFMRRIAVLAAILPVAAGAAHAQQPTPSVSFTESLETLASACGKDIDTHCAGVNLGSNRLKNCLSRNQATLTPICRDTYGKVFTLVDKRAQARIGLLKHCEADVKRLCAAAQKDDGSVIECLLSNKKIGWRCNQAMTEANFR
jgi:hypothetical protein